jgi:enamine deaminase RidA (YjgF/YER057c/UK114 family)
MTLQAIRPEEFPWFPYDGFTFCLGLVEGDAAWTSGHTSAAFDPGVGKMTVGGTMEQQARTAYEKVLAILDAAGFGLGDVTRVTENITLSGLPEYDAAVAVRTERFGDRPTVRTVVVERLVRSAAFIEVELHAVRGGGKPLVVSSDGRLAGSWQRSAVTEGHDGLVYLPTFVPVDADGEVIHPGNLAAQYSWCLDRAADTLAGVGLSLDRAVTTYDYVTSESNVADREAAESVRRERLAADSVFPAASRIVMSRLHQPGVLVALDVTASRHLRQRVDPGWAAYDQATRSPAVRAGRGLFMSGLAARDTGTGEVLRPGDLESQAEVLYEQMIELLDHEGLAPTDLLETTEYCVVDALPTYRVVAPVRERRLSPPWPASTGAICRGLDRPGLLLEVLPNALYREGA